MSNLLAEPVPSRSTARAEGTAPAFEVLPDRTAELGDGLTIRRALPQRTRRLVGPWCFLDHFGPVGIDAGPGMRVGPHPHAGLQTVTWLLEGEVLHRDSLGSLQLVVPGQLNLMTAGAGISHSEETPDAHGPRLHGLQFWLALPDAERTRDASFEHHPALPVIEHDGLQATLVTGEAFGERSPARVFSPLVGMDLVGTDTGRRKLRLESGFEYALVIMTGELETGAQPLRPGNLYYLGTGREQIELSNQTAFRAFLLGGRPLGEPVLLWWNFVMRTAEEMHSARAEWEAHSPRFGEVNGYAGPRLSAPPLTAKFKSR